jgi:hypothetical protein
LDAGTMVADIVAPIGNEWYRQLDHVIFAENFVDITASLIEPAMFSLPVDVCSNY